VKKSLGISPPPKPRFLQEPHGVTTQKTPFFIVTAVKTSNLTVYTGICKNKIETYPLKAGIVEPEGTPITRL
jgi:hypothetical protein